VTAVQAWAALAGTWAALIGVLAFGLRAIISGALVPRAQVQAMTDQWEARLTESSTRETDWRTAYQNEAMRGDADSRSLEKLMTYAETADRVLQSLPRKDA
jgi:hypothetical protein